MLWNKSEGKKVHIGLEPSNSGSEAYSLTKYFPNTTNLDCLYPYLL